MGKAQEKYDAFVPYFYRALADSLYARGFEMFDVLDQMSMDERMEAVRAIDRTYPMERELALGYISNPLVVKMALMQNEHASRLMLMLMARSLTIQEETREMLILGRRFAREAKEERAAEDSPVAVPLDDTMRGFEEMLHADSAPLHPRDRHDGPATAGLDASHAPETPEEIQEARDAAESKADPGTWDESDWTEFLRKLRRGD